MEFYKLYTDGSYQPDVDIAGIGGYLLDSQDNCLFEFSEPILDKNLFRRHEAIALIYGLKKALELGVRNISCYSDDISFRNLLNNENYTENTSENSPFRKTIFELKNSFENIQFNYIPRVENKRADKLAGKILRIYKEETLPNRTREDFLDQQQNVLFLPNLVCEEDFSNKNEIALYKAQHTYFVEVLKTAQTVDNIDDNNPIRINVYFSIAPEANFEILASIDTIQKKLVSKGLEVLIEAFSRFEELGSEQKVNLSFYADNQPLQKLEMLLRRRAVLPIPDTPLTRNFIKSTQRFEKIVLDNQFMNRSELNNVMPIRMKA